MRTPLLWTSLLLLAVAAPAMAAPGVLARGRVEAWYEFMFHGRKVGFLYSLDEPTTVEGKPALHSLRRSVLTVRRADQVIRLTSDTDAWSDADGHPIRFVHVRNENGQERRVEGERKGNELLVRVDVGGTLTVKKHPYTPDLAFSSALDAVFKRQLAVGKKAAGTALIEEEGEVKPYTMVVTGKDGDLFRVESDVAGIQSVDRVRPNGQTVSTRVERMGAEFQEASRDKALAAVDPADIFTAAHLRAGTRLPNTERLDELTVRLAGRSGRAPKPIVDARQRVVERTKEAVVLRIVADKPPAHPPKLGAKSKRSAPFLVATSYEAIGDERIVTAAREAIGDAQDQWTAARRINAFVYAHIKKKTLAQAFSTAIEALEAREGDCTEHAVLFSALAKSVGIPTRLITGLVYVDRADEGVFGYHEWVEVNLGDRWIAMDPTFGQDLADVTHVKFSQGQSDADGLREAGIVAAELFGDLVLSVTEYTEIGGKKTRP